MTTPGAAANNNDIYVSWTIDCEATLKPLHNPDLGVRAIRGWAGMLSEAGLRGTLFVVPSDAAAYPTLLRDLAKEGFEVGLHYHPQDEGYPDFSGGFTAEMQRRIFGEGARKFADAVGFPPRTFRTGNCSGNDATFPVTAELGFTSSSHSMPGRNMAHLRSNWVGSPPWPHRTHPANRLLEGDMDLVEVPVTTDTDSMLWGGAHPQDLRIELFDAKNQRYLIDKVIAREKARNRKVRSIVTLTHSTFEYSDPHDFRAQTMKQMIADFRELGGRHGVRLVSATIGQIADALRASPRE